MSNIKNVVRVMNFHALLRVDKAKKKADSYKELETELMDSMNAILNNRNLNLDKKIINSKKDGVVINFYIGNDLGFCGNFNNAVKFIAKKDVNGLKIMVGSKILSNDKNVILNISKEEFYDNPSKIMDVLRPYFEKQNIKSINAIYNRYYTISDIKIENRKLFPIEGIKESASKEDFIIESDANHMLEDLILFYINCELKIIESNSWASENIMRESLTNESLKKIDEIDEEKEKKERKEKKYKAFKKQLANYRKGNKK